MVAVTAAVTWMAASSVADVDQEQVQLQTEVATLRKENVTLKREHKALQTWVKDELRPWVIHQAVKQSAALPSAVPEPSLEPLAPLPSLVPSPSPSVAPTPSEAPSVDPSPSLCLPVICPESPSLVPTEGGSDAQ